MGRDEKDGTFFFCEQSLFSNDRSLFDRVMGIFNILYTIINKVDTSSFRYELE